MHWVLWVVADYDAPMRHAIDGWVYTYTLIGAMCSVASGCGKSDNELAPACVPSAEQCNNRDDDCDGQVDEDFSGAPLQIVSVSPDNNATGVGTLSTVSIEFSRPVAPATISNASVVVTGPVGAFVGDFSFDAAKVVFTPRNGFGVLTSHHVKVSSVKAGDDCGALDMTREWDFTTADGAWNDAVTVYSDTQDKAEVLELAGVLDDQDLGTALMIRKFGDGQKEVDVFHTNKVNQWAGRDTLQDKGSDEPRHLQLAQNVDATVLALWQMGADNFAQLIWRELTPTGWTAAGVVAPGQPRARPSLVVDANRQAHLGFFTQVDIAGSDTTYAVDFSGGQWGAPALLAPLSSLASSSQMATAPDGHAMFVWGDLTKKRILFSRFTPGSGWDASAGNVSEMVIDAAASIGVGMDAEHNAIAVWISKNGARKTVWVARYHASEQAWDSPVALKDNNSDDAKEAQLVVSASGHAIAAWTYQTQNQAVWAATYDGSGWQPASAISQNSNAAQLLCRHALFIDPRGHAVALWQNGNAGGLVYNRHRASENTWVGANDLATLNADAIGLCDLNGNRNGHGAALWTRVLSSGNAVSEGRVEARLFR